MARQSYPSIPREPPKWRIPPAMTIRDMQGVLGFIQAFMIAWVDVVDFLRRIATVLRSVQDGKLNNVGDVTLTASSTTTTLTDPLIGPNSFIDFMPTTGNAAAAFQDGAFYVSARAKGSATITHTSDANADKTFVYLVIG